MRSHPLPVTAPPRLAAAVLAVLTALCAAVVPVSAAHAETFRAHDRAHDVWRLTRAGDGDDYLAAPTRRNPDILRFAVRHGRSQLVLRARLRDAFIPPVRTGELRLRAEIAHDGLVGDVTVQATARHRQGRVSVFGRDGDCRGGTSRIDYRREVVRVSVPTSCLGDPEWVRVGFSVWSMDRSYVWEDVALTSRKAVDRRTPRIHRG